MLSIMMMATLFILSACSKNDDPLWNVSAEGSEVTASFSDNGKYGYILSIEGSGEMRDYSSAKDAPWYVMSGRITEIKVSEGVTYIGDNAFTYCYAAPTVVLPASVTKVGKNVFPSSTKVYGYASEIDVGERTVVYAYSESLPVKEGNFWHMVNGEPAAWPYVATSPMKILFVGNSYTYYNAMPTIFENIATSAGKEVEVEYLAVGSHSLIEWADPTDEVDPAVTGSASVYPQTVNGGKLLEEKLTSSNDYDIIVLQEKSTRPVKDSEYSYFVNGVAKLVKRIEETQLNCRVFLYETWGSPAYADNYGGTIPKMEAGLRAAYEKAALRTGANVSYVGKAFTYIYENYPNINLYQNDETHPVYVGSYLAACVHATTLLGIDPRNATFTGELDEDTAAIMQGVAYATVTGEDIPEVNISYDLKIAVFQRYIEQSTIKDLVAAFSQYYETESGKTPSIGFDMLGNNSTSAGGFGELVNAGKYNITFGSGNNIDSTGGVTIKGKKSVDVASYSGGRTVAYLTDDEITVAFYEFLDTPTAKKIMNPAYITEEEADKITINFVVDGAPYGEVVVVSNATDAKAKTLPAVPAKQDCTPLGWALTAEEAEGETLYSGNITYETFKEIAVNGEVTLYARYLGSEVTVITVNIAVYAANIQEDTVKGLIVAFKEFYNVEEGELLNVTYEMLGDSSTKAADFGNLVKGGNFNITIGSGNNIDSASGCNVTVKGKKAVYVASYQGDRTVAYLTEDDATVAFYEFLDTDTAKKILNPDYVSEDEAQTITLNLVVQGTPYGEAIILSSATDAVARTLPTPEADDGYIFNGWALSADETDEAKLYRGNVKYSAFEGVAQSGNVTLYAIFEKGEVEDLRIAVYHDTFDPELAAELCKAFEKWCEDNDIELNGTTYLQLDTTNQSGFSSAAVDGKYNIAIGFRANSFETGTPIKDLTIKGIAAGSARRIALLIDDDIAHKFYYDFMESGVAKKILNPDYITEEEANKIEITLICDGEQFGEKFIVSNATEAEDISLPEMTKDGYVFSGWALTAEAEENETYLSGKIVYADVENLTDSGTLILYARYKEGEKPQSIKVAIWTRYVQLETVRSLLTAFENSDYFVDGALITYGELTSSNNNNFKTDYEDGKYNIAFGYKAAAVDSWQDKIVEIYIFSVSDNAMGTLKVGVNSSDEVALNFAEFLATDEAKKIMNPAYVSEEEADTIVITLMNGEEQYGETLTVSNATEAEDISLPEMTAEDGYKFSGWALTAEAEEDETYLSGKIGYADIEILTEDGTLILYARYEEIKEDEPVVLKVAVYKKFIDQIIADDLKEAFEAYCSANNIHYDELHVDLMTIGKGSEFMKDSEGYDIVIGHKGGTSFEAKEKITVAMLLNEDNGGAVAEDRLAERLTDTDIAKKFMEFLQTEEAQKAMTQTGNE